MQNGQLAHIDIEDADGQHRNVRYRLAQHRLVHPRPGQGERARDGERSFQHTIARGKLNPRADGHCVKNGL